MLQGYVRNVLAVSFLCCNKCFHVASCKCFIWMLHMFHTHVVSICFKCFICFKRMFRSSVSCCKCFVFQWCSESYGGMARAPGEGARRAGCRRMWHGTRLGSCGRGMLVLVLAPARRERRGSGGGAACTGRGETDEGRVRVRGGTRQAGPGRGGWGQTRHMQPRTVQRQARGSHDDVL